MISPPNCSTGFSSWNTRSFTKISTTTTFNTHNIELQPRPRDCISRLAISSIQPRPGQSPSLQWINQHQPGHITLRLYSSHEFSSETRIGHQPGHITLRFFTQVMSFPQKPEIRHQPGQSHWGFCSSHKFSSETRFRTPAIKRQRQAILDLHETSLQHLEVIQCYFVK